MILEFHDGFALPTRQHVTRCLLLDDNGNPVMAAMDHGDGSYTVTHIAEGQTEFQRGLKLLGINKAIVVEDLDLNKLKQRP